MASLVRSPKRDIHPIPDFSVVWKILHVDRRPNQWNQENISAKTGEALIGVISLTGFSPLEYTRDSGTCVRDNGNRRVLARSGRLAQLVRAPALQAGGRRFESCTAHHIVPQSIETICSGHSCFFAALVHLPARKSQPLLSSGSQTDVNATIFPRCSGILLHITSLPGSHGIGDLGKSAYEFVEFLSSSGQKIWQVLPLGPTGYGDSPYQLFSAFAGNPLLIDLDALREQGLLSSQDLAAAVRLPDDHVEFGKVIEFKLGLLERAAQVFFADASEPDRSSFERFCGENSGWLDDYSLFMACKSFYKDAVWSEWARELRQREEQALYRWRQELAAQIRVHKFAQYEFFRQWDQLKGHCRRCGVRIMGDVPIYVAHDSADVWAHQELFRLDEHGRPAAQAGVPPDYFSATGQLWGNPLYRWDVSAVSGHRWWIDRFRSSLKLFDLVRLDHFRGFEAYWEVPAEAATAENGKWVKGPGAEFFAAVKRELKELPFVAENLGVITPEVEALRKRFGFPGMSLLQFAFGNDPQGPSFRPHNYSRELVAYTGGHDNDTTVGWWTSAGVGESVRTAEDIRRERSFTRAYLGFQDETIQWVFIRAVTASVAEIAIVPLQDVLGLGSEARMNLPGTVRGNWKWRFRGGDLTHEHSDRLRELTLLYDR
jgi:4-alpha-glucanotransferase